MSLRHSRWGSLTFVPPTPKPKITSGKRIWETGQTRELEPEPEPAFEDAQESIDIQEKTYDDLENQLENKWAEKEIKRRNEIFKYIVTNFLKKRISDIGDESVEYLARISNTNSERIIRFIETNESTIDSKIKTALRKAKEEQPEFYTTERSLREVIGINKPTWRIYDYNYDLTVMEERFNILTFTSGNAALLYAR